MAMDAHAVIAHKRAHRSKHADRKAIRAPTRPLDTPESCMNHAFRATQGANASTTPNTKRYART